MTSLQLYNVSDGNLLNTYGYAYNDKLYYYCDGIKLQLGEVTRNINVRNCTAFTIVMYKFKTYIIANEMYFSSHDHYFDDIINKLVVIDCDTELSIDTNKFSNADDKYVKKIDCNDYVITLYDKFNNVICQLSIDSLLC
jgi:hypothetical protein